MSSGTHVFRFSLTSLFGAVLFAAFGTAAIRFASPLWAGLTMALTVPLLFAAILGALFRLGQARAFWTGMAVCGWGYLLIVLAPWFESSVGQHLPTSYLLNYVHDHLQTQVTLTPWRPGGGMVRGPGPSVAGRVGIVSPARTDRQLRKAIAASRGLAKSARFVPSVATTGPDHSIVLRTGHALFALLFGFIGGVTAKWFYLTRSPQEDENCQG
jgi:hypothetical protein